MRREANVLEHAIRSGNFSHTCLKFGISRDANYRWKRQYENGRLSALVNSKPCPEKPTIRVPLDVEKNILYFRREFISGRQRFSWYLDRYYGIKVSSIGVYGVLKRHGINRLPKGAPKRSTSTIKRYVKEVPGHQIQVDVKFPIFPNKSGKRVKRYQFTAIDDAKRILAFRIYRHHTQDNAIEFLSYVIEKFPFRIKYVHTDYKYKIQSKFHWHDENLGIVHRYIKPASPHLNGKVERSHLTVKQEFYQLLNYTGDRNLRRQLVEWVAFYNYDWLHGALHGRTPYEMLETKIVA